MKTVLACWLVMLFLALITFGLVHFDKLRLSGIIEHFSRGVYWGAGFMLIFIIVLTLGEMGK